MKLSKKHVFEEWVSTLFGTILLVLTLVYIGKLIWFTPEKVTGAEIGSTIALGAIGIMFVFVKLDFIMKYLPGSKGGEDVADKPS